MTIAEFFEFALYALLGYSVSVFVISTVKTYNKIKEADEIMANTEEIKDVIAKLIIVNVEKHGDMFYLYEVGTENFIAQGRTKDEIADVCIQRFPNKLVVLSTEQENDYGLAES